MRKWVFITLLVYGLIAIVLVTQDKKDTEIIFFASPIPVARVLSNPNETVRLPFYTDSQNHYLFDDENIESATIRSENLTMAVQVVISKTKGVLNVGAQDCLGMAFQLSFTDVRPEEALMQFNDPTLEIFYVNGRQIFLAIQDITLCFTSIESSPHLDFTRLHPLMNTIKGDEYLSGIYIELINKSSEEVTVTDISMLMNGCDTNMQLIEETEESPGIALDDGYMWDWKNALLPSERINAFELTDEKIRLIIPIQYQEFILSPSRFPLMISYETEGKQYTWMIDDYLFFSSERPTFWEEEHGTIQYIEA